MLDLNLIRKSPDKVLDLLQRRGKDYSSEIEKILELDKLWRSQLVQIEELKQKKNQVSKDIGLKKRSGEEVSSDIMTQMKEISNQIKELESDFDHKDRMTEILLIIPNLPDENLARQDQIINQNADIPNFDFELKTHWEIAEKLDIMDFKRAAKLSGSRFAILKAAGAELEMALINFMLDLHRTRFNYTQFMLPYLVRPEVMIGTGQLPKFEEDMYSTSEEEIQDKLYLIPTAEVPLTNMHSGEILSEDELPKKYMAYTPCFRREAGSYGKDTSGLIRQHQFNKIELVNICSAQDSNKMHEQLLLEAEEVLKQLGLVYRVIELGSEDFGFSAFKTWDLEIWMPGEQKWREVSSCSNCRDFQARRMATRYRKDGKTEYVHTLNSSGVAVGRVLAGVIETFQTSEGTIKIPEILQKYMNGRVEIAKN